MGTLSPRELDHTRSHGKLGKILLKKKPRGPVFLTFLILKHTLGHCVLHVKNI